MEKSFGLSFYLKKNKHDRNRKSMIYMRITVDGDTCDISTKRKCESKRWNKISGRMSIKEEGALEFNSYLDTLQQKVFEAKRKLIELDREISPTHIKDVMLGISLNREKRMLMQIFQHHNDQIIWNNPNQHNVYGKNGPGVQYEISIWDSWFKEYRSENVQNLVKRNSSILFGTISTEYGNYMGETSLFKVGANGNFTSTYDYSIPPVDAVDNFAYHNDIGYDKLRVVGPKGLFDDWGTTPVDEVALNGWVSFRENYKEGDIDPFNGQKVTYSERHAAWKGAILFAMVVDQKKSAISEFIRTNYSDNEHSGRS
jgi:hypothetical protein